MSDDPIASLRVSVAVLEAKVKMLTEVVRSNMVTKSMFSPVKMITYGLASIVLVAVLVAVLRRIF